MVIVTDEARWTESERNTTEAVLAAAPSLAGLGYTDPLLAHSNAIIHCVFHCHCDEKEKHLHTHRDYSHTISTARDTVLHLQQEGLNNGTHILNIKPTGEL